MKKVLFTIALLASLIATSAYAESITVHVRNASNKAKDFIISPVYSVTQFPYNNVQPGKSIDLQLNGVAGVSPCALFISTRDSGTEEWSRRSVPSVPLCMFNVYFYVDENNNTYLGK